MHNRLVGVVTGGTKGIGKAVVESLARTGFDVLFCARNEADVQALQNELVAKYADQSFWGVSADLSKPAGRQLFSQALTQNCSQVDLLLNNTGVFLPGGILTEAEGTLEKLVETNIYSAYHITRAVFPLMKESKRAHIFNLCSTASITAYVNGGSYAITKFGLLGMSKVLREELKPHGVKVTAILPGPTKTASWEGTDLPDDRFMQASDVADMLLATYNLSPSAVVEEILMRPLPGDI
ncbi:MAG: short-chain dehydrogenase [Sphingobacteriaceae bacterium]|nr:short-chain dehydrogenase [Sphingobacteriaceae bacterium]